MGYYYILSSDVVSDFFIKIGITERHPKHRYEEHLTSHGAYSIYSIVKLASSELFALEKYVLAKTFKFNFRPELINNECRYKLNPADVMQLVVEYLDSRKIDYKIIDDLSAEPDLHQTELNNKEYFKSKDELDEFVKSMEFKLDQPKNAEQISDFPCRMRDYQISVSGKCAEFFAAKNACVLNWACGLGKTWTSLYILYNYCKSNNTEKILIGVSSIAILKQWLENIKKIKFFDKYARVLITGARINGEFCTTSNYDETGAQLVICMYHSSKVVSNKVFGFAIFDECHHLTGEETKGFKMIFQSNREKTLSLTATMKRVETGISNFDESIFGPVIDYKSIHWAIENKYITDYSLLVLETEESIIAQFKQVNADLFLSAWSVLYGMYHCINNMSHTFIYTNSKRDAELVVEYIKKITDAGYFPLDNLVYSKVDSDISDVDQAVKNFREAKYGIIVCVFMLSEGFDEPIIDSVCVSKQMISVIRSIQSLLRGNRLLPSRPDKINTVILPTSSIDDVYNNILGSLIDNIRNEDKNIEEKITCLSVSKTAGVTNERTSSVPAMIHEDIARILLFKVIHSKRMTIRQIYDFYSEYHVRFKFTRIEDYKKIKSDPKYKLSFINDPTEYFNTIWNSTNKYYGFLAIDCSKFPVTKADWIKKCKDIRIESVRDYYDRLDSQSLDMPYDYPEYYNVGHGEEPWLKRVFKLL